MREHIYKAWSKEKGRWLTLDDRLTVAGEEDYWHNWVSGTAEDGTIFLFQDMGAELVEYIELKDCKRTKKYPEGQMIFEGDILKVMNPNSERDTDCVVEWDKRGGYVCEPADGYGEFDLSTIGWAMEMEYHFEVIGNKFENPELLEVNNAGR